MKAFLSHSSKDKEFVRAVATTLHRQYCVFDENSFETGTEFKKSIEKGLDESSVFVLFASSNSLSSVWVEFEIDEAWYRRLQHKLTKSLVYLIDSSTGYDSLPAWLQRAVIRRFNAPQLVARDIRHHLDDLIRERQNPYFVGRSQDIELFEQAFTPVQQTNPPHSLIVSGLPGIGRRSLVKHVIPSVLNLRKFVEIRIGEGDTIQDICATIADRVEPYSTIAGLKTIIQEIMKLTDKQALARISRNLTSIIEAAEFPIIFDNGGFMDTEGRLREPIKHLIELTTGNSTIYASFISYRRPTVLDFDNLPALVLRPLGPSETKRLTKLIADQKDLSISPEQLEDIASYIAGYPPSAYFAVHQAKEIGIELLMRVKSRLVNFRTSVFIRHFAAIGLSPEEKHLLMILAFYNPLPLAVITHLLSIDPKTLDKILIRLIDLSFVIVTDCGHYSIADPLKDAVLNAFDFPEQSEHLKVVDLLSSYLGSADIEGPQLELSRALFRAARIAGDTKLASETVHLANDLIRLTETLYHARRYDDSIQTAYTALDERPDSITARQYLIRGLIQVGKWPEAEEEILDLKKYAPSRECLFLQGFLERHRGNIPQAITYYKSAKEQGWKGVALDRELAQCCFLIGDDDTAAEYIKNASKVQSDNPYILDISAQIAIRRQDKETAEQTLQTLELIDEKLFYFHRRSQFERAFGSLESALELSRKAVACEDFPPFHIMSYCAVCEIELNNIPEARALLKAIDERFPRVHHDIRYNLKCRLEIISENYSEALRLSGYIEDKDTFFYKKIRYDALNGELSTSALRDKTRQRYKAELAQLEEEISPDYVFEFPIGDLTLDSYDF